MHHTDQAPSIQTRRRVILVSLDWTRAKDPRVPLGHASLLAALEAAGQVDVASLVFDIRSPGFSPTAVVDACLHSVRGSCATEVDIALGAYVWNEPFLPEILHALRARGFAGRLILGGPQISYCGPGVASLYPEADAFIRGYGEAALVEVTRQAARVSLPGVHWSGEEDQASVAAVDLETIPSPLLNGILPVREGQPYVRWETQRGCPYRCSFCQHREAGRLTNRVLSSQRLQAELELFAQNSVGTISVLDPIFNLGSHGHHVLASARALGVRSRLSLQCRFERLDTEFLDLCSDLNVSLEFGIQTIHLPEGRAIQRLNRRDLMAQRIVALLERRIPFEVNLIYALPEQTLDSFKESVDFCLRLGAPVIKAFPLVLLRGTPLERQRDRWKLVESAEAIPRVIQSNTFSTEDWRRMAALSEALEATEGRHPSSIEELWRMAAAYPVDAPPTISRQEARLRDAGPGLRKLLEPVMMV